MWKNCVSLVTGGASGLGKAVLERIVKGGGRVILCDLPKSAGEEVAKSHGDSVIFVPTDITKTTDISYAHGICEEKFGQLNVTVNCAGIVYSQRLYDHNKDIMHSLEKFQNVIDTNLTGTFNVICHSARLMNKNEPNSDLQRGVIVNTASIAAYEGQIGQVAYAASKAAIVGLTLPIARDLSRLGIRMCSIAPGLFKTPMLESLPEKVQSHLVKNIPFPQRFGEPDEYAQLVETIVFNPMLNGETIRLDGGLRMSP